MRKLIFIAALAGVAVFAATASGAPSGDAVRAVQTASRGLSSKPVELDRERRHWEVSFADGTERKVTLDGKRVTATHRDDDRSAAPTGIGLVAALRAAAPRVSGQIEDADFDDGVWTVGIGDKDVDVDPRTGRVLRVTRDD
jgi:uncharacterized membrane protein YkoI